MFYIYLFFSIYLTIDWSHVVSGDKIKSYDNETYSNRLYHKNICSGTYDCLKGDVIHALEKLNKSPKYYLLEGVRFEKRRNVISVNDVPVISRNSNLLELFRKTADIFRTHALVWSCLPGIDLWIFQDTTGRIGLSIKNSGIKNGRTFGLAKRRLAMVMLPIMFKLGVIITLLVLLTVFTLKSLAVGLLLLFFASAGIVGKLKHLHSYPQAPPSSPPHKDVHIHVHPYDNKHHDQAYHGWHRDSYEEEPPSSQTSPPPPWTYLPAEIAAYYSPRAYAHS